MLMVSVNWTPVNDLHETSDTQTILIYVTVKEIVTHEITIAM